MRNKSDYIFIKFIDFGYSHTLTVSLFLSLINISKKLTKTFSVSSILFGRAKYILPRVLFNPRLQYTEQNSLICSIVSG